jgi:hypothetical protein
MAAFVAKQMVGNKLSAVKGEFKHKLSRDSRIYASSKAIKPTFGESVISSICEVSLLRVLDFAASLRLFILPKFCNFEED